MGDEHEYIDSILDHREGKVIDAIGVLSFSPHLGHMSFSPMPDILFNNIQINYDARSLYA